MKKINNLLALFVVGLLLFATACDPIEKRDELNSLIAVNDLELNVIYVGGEGNNRMVIEMNSPGVTGYWDWNFGKSLTNRDSITYMATGISYLKFYGSTGDTQFVDSIQIDITKMDYPLPDTWAFLVGVDPIAGKTWVLATDRPEKMAPYDNGPEALFSFMSAPYNWLELWWNAGGTCCPPVDVNAEMTFDLANGSTNYTYLNEDATTNGTFSLKPSDETLQIIGADLVGAYGAPGQIADTQDGLYQLKVISETEMILYQVHGTGWTWIFKPKGYEYPAK